MKAIIKAHGERLLFMAITLAIGAVLWNIEMKGEAKTLLIGVGTLALNKARSPRQEGAESNLPVP